MNIDLLQGIGRLISNLSKEGFYGVLELQFQDGEIILVRKQESFKPSSLMRNSADQRIFVVVKN